MDNRERAAQMYSEPVEKAGLARAAFLAGWDADKWIKDELPPNASEDVEFSNQVIIAVLTETGHVYVSTGLVDKGQWHWFSNSKKMSPEFRIIGWQPLPLWPEPEDNE